MTVKARGSYFKFSTWSTLTSYTHALLQLYVANNIIFPCRYSILYTVTFKALHRQKECSIKNTYIESRALNLQFMIITYVDRLSSIHLLHVLVGHVTTHYNYINKQPYGMYLLCWVPLVKRILGIWTRI